MNLSDNGFFKILGQNNDDKTIYFIDRSGLMQNWSKDRIGQKQLLTLAPLSFWRQWGTGKNESLRSDDWLIILDNILEYSKDKYLNPDDVLGRGSWLNDDDDLCYHDGLVTTGKYDPKQIFLKKNQMKIGIDAEPLESDIAKQML
jgi:hypothetical protein